MMNKENNKGKKTDKKQSPENIKSSGKNPRLVMKAADITVDMVSATVSSVLKVLGTVMLILLVSGMMFACVFAYYVKTCLTPRLDLSLEDFKLNESSTIWYQDSVDEWRELATLSGEEKRVWVDYDQIPWYMEKALVAIEDKRFYEHKGVDWYRTAGAFVTIFTRGESGYGGSTITQQLIKNLTGEKEVTIQRKLTEIFAALELEKNYDKQEIMEWYLNAVYFGEGCWGVQTAAQTYFGKDVSDLSMAECASIVGITNLPTYYDPFYSKQNNKERQETILREMYEQGYIDHEQYRQAVAEELVFTHSPDENYTQEIMSYYTETVIEDVTQDLMKQKGISHDTARTLLLNGGYQIYSCIDADIQNCVDAVYSDLTAIPRTAYSEQQLQSAIVIMDPYDGRILALSGGVGEKDRNFPLNRATGTYRSPGSSIKPIASYGPAVDLGLITPDTLVNDSANITLSGTSWYPNNDSYTNYGVVTIYSALQYSLNTVAAQIVDKLPLGPQTSYDYLTTHLGVTSLVPEDCNYAPMALGQLTNGITVREMAQAYCAFVNDGIFTYGRTYSAVTDKDGNVIIDNSPSTIQAFKPNTAYTMTYMMQNGVENGTGGEAALWTMPVAGKTGTSGNYQDRWFVGCTPYYVAAVWTGYDTPERIHVGGNPAAQLWKKVMTPVHDGLPWEAFTYPYLGPNTGIFGIEDKADIGTGDEFLDEDNGFSSGGSSDDAYSGGGSYTGGGSYSGDDSYNGGTSGGDEFLSGGGGRMSW